MPRCTGPWGSEMRWYTVYDRKTEEIITCGPAQKVAQALGMTMDSFYCSVSRSATGKQRKYEYYVEDVDEDDLLR